MLHPMSGDVDSLRNPHLVVLEHVVEKSLQADGSRRAPDHAIMNRNHHHLRLVVPFTVEHVESILHVGKEIVGGDESEVLVESVVVRLVGRRDHQVRLVLNVDPVRQLVAERVPVVQETTLLYQQPPGVGTRPPRHPADRSAAADTLEAIDGAFDVLALHFLGDVLIVNPAPWLTIS